MNQRGGVEMSENKNVINFLADKLVEKYEEIEELKIELMMARQELVSWQSKMAKENSMMREELYRQTKDWSWVEQPYKPAAEIIYKDEMED
tara:strand:+ start:52 stop:324 length:273 start_codon:yes stop_codon:yes gene_type:complete